MQLSTILTLAIAGVASCALVPRADDNRHCDCPTYGPYGTCVIKPAPLLPHNAPQSSFCGAKGFSYACEGTYDYPDCNACAQSLLGNIKQPGRNKQCDGGKFCSNDKGATWHICAHDEAPFVPPYYTDISYSGSDSAAVIANEVHDLNWLHDTIPKWFTSVCYEKSCQAAPSKWPSADFVYSGPALALSKGTLTLGISEAQFSSAAERDLMVQLASLAIVRAAKCEQQTYREKCTPQNTECGPKKITVCKGPSDVNIQMNKYDDNGESTIHAFLHFQLKWDDKSTPFDCGVLDKPLSIVEQIGDWTDTKKVVDGAGVVKTLCKGIEAILDFTKKD